MGATAKPARTKKILWEVDVQKDFVLPGGKLYVPGAEKLIPNINRLVDVSRAGKVFLVSSGCQHSEDDPEFSAFPPHCVRGTDGARLIPEGLTEDVVVVPNDPAHALPAEILKHKQVLLEKQTIDVFESAHAAAMVALLPPNAEYFVFGVTTEYCVRGTAKGLLERGRHVSIITDAVAPLDPAAGRKVVEELATQGARFLTTQEALAQLESA